jgi:hypothetical protein
MQQHGEKILAVKYDRASLMAVILKSALFLVIGLIVVRFGHPLLGWSLVAYCCYVALPAGARLFDRRVVVVVDRGGVFDRRVVDRKIPWDQIKRVRSYVIGDAAPYRGIELSVHLGSFCLSVDNLDVEHDAILGAIDHYMRAKTLKSPEP